MKLKKILKVLPPWEMVKVWGEDETTPLFYGEVEKVPKYLRKMEADKVDGSYTDYRYGCIDCEAHVVVFVKED